MSDRTAEISGTVKATSAGTTDALSRAEQCLEFARDKYETAAAHGWAGVAGNMELAAAALEGVTEQLASAEQASQAVASTLDEITDKLSSPEVVAHLVSASSELDTVRTASEASISLIDEAIGHCEAAGQQSLPSSLSSLRDDVTQIVERLGQVGHDLDAERQAAEDFSDQADDGAESGN